MEKSCTSAARSWFVPSSAVPRQLASMNFVWLSLAKIIPDDVTHIVLSASGNDLLRLLNEVEGIK